MTGTGKQAVFAPVCMYANSLYRTRQGVEFVVQRFLEPAERTLLLICDEIYAFSLLSKTEERFLKPAREKANNLGDNLDRMIAKVLSRSPAAETTRQARWADIAGHADYQRVRQAMEASLPANPDIAWHIDRFVTHFVPSDGGEPDRWAKRWEREYVVAEIAMSLYVTQALGYSFELWEKPAPAGVVDPIGYLYRERPDLVTAWTGVEWRPRSLKVIATDEPTPTMEARAGEIA